MADTLKLIIQHLNQAEDLKNQVAESDLDKALKDLRLWQTKRLLASHDDLWQSKRFKPAMAFFIDELYGPKDFSQRDQDIARMVPKMAKILPVKALNSLESALRLNSLSFHLDVEMASRLKDQKIDRDAYQKAYRDCDNQDLRSLQIDLLESLGLDLADVVKISGISMLLKLSRKPAKIAGVESLHLFLESGFKAFRKLGEVNDFILPIIQRERQLMIQLFNDDSSNPLPQVELD